VDTGFQADKNTDTSKEGYFIRHAGSLFLGDCNKQNTINEILALTKDYHYEPFTTCKRDKLGGRWHFRGNFRELSNVFDVDIWNQGIELKEER